MATASTHLSPDLGARRRPIPVRAFGARLLRITRRNGVERIRTRDALGSPSVYAVRSLDIPDIHR